MRQAALTGKRVTARYYRNQYQHWLCFLDSWARPELYADQSRQQRKRTPAQLYASIRCPEMLLFLAAAAGLPEKLLQEAAEASLNAIGAHHNKRTDELRRVISWDVIEAALLAHPKLDLATVHAVEGSPGEPLSFLTDDGDRKTIWDSRTLSARAGAKIARRALTSNFDLQQYRSTAAYSGHPAPDDQVLQVVKGTDKRRLLIFPGRVLT